MLIPSRALANDIVPESQRGRIKAALSLLRILLREGCGSTGRERVRVGRTLPVFELLFSLLIRGPSLLTSRLSVSSPKCVRFLVFINVSVSCCGMLKSAFIMSFFVCVEVMNAYCTFGSAFGRLAALALGSVPVEK